MQFLHMSLAFAIPLGLLLASIVGTAVSFIFIRPLRQLQVPSWGLLIVSLGLYLISQNVLSIVYGDKSQSVRSGIVSVGHNIFGAYVTDIQLATFFVSIFILFSLNIFLVQSSLGRTIRGVSSNGKLCCIFGIAVEKTILWAVAIGSALAALGGMLVALDTDMTPTMGFRLMLYGIMVFIIGGMGSYRGLVLGALLLGFCQQVVAHFFDSKWMDAVSFLILIIFLIWKPLGFSGRRLKKVEI